MTELMSPGSRQAVGTPPGARSIRVSVCVEQELVAAGLRAALQEHRDIDVVDGGGPMFAMPVVDRAAHVAHVVVAVAGTVARLSRVLGRAEWQDRSGIIAVGGDASGHALLSAIHSGVRGFVSERAVMRELPAAVRIVAGGGAFVSVDFTTSLLDWVARQLPADTARYRRAARHLSEREQQVLRLLGHGYSNIEIARELVIAEATVRSHVYHILTKLDLPNRTRAVLFAYQFGLTVSVDRIARLAGGGDRAREMAVE